jgi:chemotaxis protein methyltransferase CheR
MARVAATDPLEYKDLLDSDPGAFNALITELTVGETYFLRESGQFDFVVREVLPDLRRRVGPDLFLRAWSAGCASGEEAYSLAIVARESQPGFAMRVLGTDIAESRLAVARKAVYGEWSLRGVPEEIVNRNFVRTDHRVKVIPEIRSMVEFRSLNLMDSDWTAAGIRPGGMDLIFCRNVFIYLDAATVAHIAGRLIESLHEGGWLFLGASDPALADIVDCEVVVTGAGIAYRRGGTTPRLASRAVTVTEPADRHSDKKKVPEGDSLPAQGKMLQDAALLLNQASQAYQSADYSRAADAAREAVAVDGTEPTGWIVLVRSLANMGRHEEAGLACAAGLDINRTSAELTYMHALLLRQAAKNADALNALRCAVYLDRLFVVAHLAMGDVLGALGDRDAARRAFRNAERLLAGTPDSQMIPGADGLDAGRLLAVAQMQLTLLERVAAQ